MAYRLSYDLPRESNYTETATFDTSPQVVGCYHAKPHNARPKDEETRTLLYAVWTPENDADRICVAPDPNPLTFKVRYVSGHDLAGEVGVDRKDELFSAIGHTPSSRTRWFSVASVKRPWSWRSIQFRRHPLTHTLFTNQYTIRVGRKLRKHMLLPTIDLQVVNDYTPRTTGQPEACEHRQKGELWSIEGNRYLFFEMSWSILRFYSNPQARLVLRHIAANRGGDTLAWEAPCGHRACALHITDEFPSEFRKLLQVSLVVMDEVCESLGISPEELEDEIEDQETSGRAQKRRPQRIQS